MKRALIGIVSTGIFAVSVGVESANAQTYGPYSDSRAYTSRAYAAQSRSTVRRGVPRTAPLYRNPDSPEASGGTRRSLNHFQHPEDKARIGGGIMNDEDIERSAIFGPG